LKEKPVEADQTGRMLYIKEKRKVDRRGDLYVHFLCRHSRYCCSGSKAQRRTASQTGGEAQANFQDYGHRGRIPGCSIGYLSHSNLEKLM
jgi:hypothetical protein